MATAPLLRPRRGGRREYFRALPYAFVWIATGKALQFSGYRGVTDRACAGNGPTIFP